MKDCSNDITNYHSDRVVLNPDQRKLLRDRRNTNRDRLKRGLMAAHKPLPKEFVIQGSFNSRFRAECLDRELLYTLSESRVVFADWRHYYNHERPHRPLGLQTPKQFAKKITRQGPDSGRPTGSLRRGLAHNGNNNQPAEIIS